MAIRGLDKYSKVRLFKTAEEEQAIQINLFVYTRFLSRNIFSK